MKPKRTMSYVEQIRILNITKGAAWLFAGIFNCFDNLVCTILQIVALLVCIIGMIRVAVAKKENSDEMAEENLCKAKAMTLDIMHGGFCVLSIVAMLILGRNTITLNWSKTIPAVFFMVLGVQDLLVGSMFRKLEDA